MTSNGENIMIIVFEQNKEFLCIERIENIDNQKLRTMGINSHILVGFIGCICWSIEGCHLDALYRRIFISDNFFFSSMFQWYVGAD
jgi:hypothetical protein